MGSKVTYVENYISTCERSEAIVNIVTEVFARDDAQVFFGAVDNLAKGTTVYVNRRGVTGRHARIEWALGLMNDGNTISENITRLIGDGSVGDTKTVVVSRGEQVQNFTTSVIHYGKHTEGYILKHGVVKDEATSILTALVKLSTGHRNRMRNKNRVYLC